MANKISHRPNAAKHGPPGRPDQGARPAGRLTERHLALFRVLWANAWQPKDGGRPSCTFSQARQAKALGRSTRTVRRLLADLRQPGPDQRHPNTAPAGLRSGHVTVYPQRRPHPRGRGGHMLRDNRIVLNTSLAEMEALVRGECHHPAQVSTLAAALADAKSLDGALVGAAPQANGHLPSLQANGNGAAPAQPASGADTAADRLAPSSPAGPPRPPPRGSPEYRQWEENERARKIAEFERWARDVANDPLPSRPADVDRSPPPGRSSESWP